MARRHRCFIITPFGDRMDFGSPWRRDTAQHVDLIYERLLAPAKERCEAEGYPIEFVDGRAYVSSITTGGISDKILQEIEKADVLLVILFQTNANVYLELGWAMGLWRDPIILAHKGYDLPSDIKAIDRIGYWTEMLTDPSGAAGRPLIDELVTKVKEAINGHPRRNPQHVPANVAAMGHLTVHSRFSEISMPEWANMLYEAERQIVFCTPRGYDLVNLKFPLRLPDGSVSEQPLAPLVLDRAKAGIQTTIMFHDYAQFTSDLLGERADPATLVKARADAQEALKAWGTLRLTYLRGARASSNASLSEDGLRVVLIQDRYMPYRITFTDKRALVTPRFYTETFNSQLCIDVTPQRGLRFPKDRPFYDQVAQELRFLIEENAKMSEQRLREEIPGYAAFFNSGAAA